MGQTMGTYYDSYGGNPRPNRKLRFHDSNGPVADAWTNDSGQYSVYLAGPKQYKAADVTDPSNPFWLKPRPENIPVGPSTWGLWP